MRPSSMWTALGAEGPAPDRVGPMMLYGRFVGSWEGTVVLYERGGPRRESCEVHFDWTLEGRAVQDVWIAPARRGRRTGEQGFMYGTTLRVYDPDAAIWHISWTDPVRQMHARMTGRPVGDDIVQEYTDGDVRHEWRFTENTPSPFHLIGRKNPLENDRWRLIDEFFVQPTGQPHPPPPPGPGRPRA